MKHKIIVGQVNDVYVVSDDGAVSRKLGLQPAVPWHLVADSVGGIGERVAQMEALLDKAALFDKAPPPVSVTRSMIREIIETPVALGFSSPREREAERSRGEQKQGNGRNGNGNGAKLTIDDLGLSARQRWRLEKAIGDKAIGSLGSLTEEQLAAKKGIGPAIVKSVKKGLKKHGLRLTEPVG